MTWQQSGLDTALADLATGFRRLKGIGEGATDDSAEILFEEWDWEIGVGLYGAFREAEAAGDTEALARIGRWYDRKIAEGLPRIQVNSTAPMLTLALLADRTDRQDWRRIVRDWADWIHDTMPRTEEAGYQHTVKERDNDGQLWDDTLFMAVLFMAAAGRAEGRRDWSDDAEAQFLTHIRFLGDAESGLFFHGWTFIGRHNYARALWARGNAWVTIAIPELFRIARPSGAVARHLGQVWRTQVAALLPLQGESGLFHTLLDDPHSPPEASGSAGIGYGILAGAREGLLADAPFAGAARGAADRIAAAIIARIGPEGYLTEVSDGTPMGDTLDFYRRIPNTPTPYGQALGSLFLGELSRRGGQAGTGTAAEQGGHHGQHHTQ